MTDGNQGWHVESSSQVTTTTSADPRFLFDGGAGTKLPRIQSAKSNPLARVQGVGQHGEFTEYLQSASFAESWSRHHEMKTAIQLGVAGDQSEGFAPQP